MSPKSFAFLEKLVLVLLVSSFTLPLGLGAWLRIFHTKSSSNAWFRNATLAGIQVSPKPAAFNYEEARAGRFQAAYADYYNTNFPARELLIRLTNEFYLDFFRVSPVGVMIGPHRSLIEPAYLQEYYLQRDKTDALRPIVTGLRRMQDYCEAHGTPFLMLITPSKAAIYPENNPKGWRSRYQPGPRGYEHFVALLQEKGVHFVDGHRITADLKAAPDGPTVFPLGSVHWSDPPALATANAVLAFLASRGVQVAPITKYETKNASLTNGSEADLANLLNPIVPMRVAAPVVTIAPGPEEDLGRPNLVLVGGSFLWKIADHLQAARLFSEIHVYFYYRQSKHVISDDTHFVVEGGAPPRSFANDVLGADAIVLECNEQRLTEPNHLAAFLHDALAAIPAISPGVYKPPFHYERRLSHRWDITLPLKSPLPAAVTLPPMSGFSPPGDIGVYTIGPVATLRLGPVPPPPEDLVLEVSAGWPITSPTVPEQQVDVFVNGHPIGSMAWDGVKLPTRQELLIPKGCLDAGGGLALEFRVAHPLSPLELGHGGDDRKMGVCVSSVRVYTAHPAPPGDMGPNRSLSTQAAYRWGEEVSVAEGKPHDALFDLRGFASTGHGDAFTQSEKVSMRLAVTPPRGAVELTADANNVVLGPGQPSLTAQVCVDGHPVGEWTWDKNAPSQRKAIIPPGLITGSSVRLELRFGHILSLREMGVGTDSRKLGVCFSTFRLTEAGQ